ncbi:anti-sigma factor family protein [Synechococcus elongatus]|uniref:anti-sigma factor family protein n=1 Tax=Synechococcus elongatus TaxID=32046 RepID=UPI000F7EE170|nr:hypothetical protein [Synechococcus elongatus]
MSEQRSFERTSEPCFELLSAYLDNAVTATERKQVEQWLAEDADAQATFAQLRQLQQVWSRQRLAVISSDRSAEAIAAAVFADPRVRRRRWQRWAIPTGLAAMVAVAVGNSLVPEFSVRTATNRDPVMAPYPTGEPLFLALDEPVIELPRNPNNRVKPAAFLPASRR